MKTLLRLWDRLLYKLGLMRVSQQLVKELQISDNHLLVVLKNGFRWSGYLDREALAKTDWEISPVFNPYINDEEIRKWLG